MQSDTSIEEQSAFLQEAAKSNLVNFAELVKKGYQAEFFHEIIGILLQEAAEKVKRKEKVRIILSVPPRHGKTELASTIFPAWALGKYPEMKFILSSYGADLSETIGMKTRDLINSEAYQFVFPGITLRPDVKAKAKWMTNKDGSFTGVGMGTAVTGTGADCVVGSTTVYTNRGVMTIKELVSCHQSLSVLSWNHEYKKLEWKKVLASATRPLSDIVSIRTSKGNSIRCTPDHRIYIQDRGYIPASELIAGDTLLCTNDMSWLWKKNGDVHSATKKVSKDWDKRSKLQSRMSKRKENIGGHPLLFLWKSISKTKLYFKILSDEMQKRLSFKNNDGDLESYVPKRNTNKSLSTGIQGSEEESINTGQSLLCGVFKKRTLNCSSYRSQSEEQRPNESCDTLPILPLETSCITSDTVSVVERLPEKEVVYDIQVEDNHNFFALDILISNCIIIDDPHKDRAEAESETVRESVWEYYRSTLYSRLEGYGAVIIIMQRWHTDDLVGKVKEESARLKAAGGAYDEWEIINFPAVAEEDEYFRGQLIRKQGEPLWPSKFPLDVLENIKQTSGIYNWVSQYMQDPIATEAQEFKEFYFKYFEEQELTHKRLRYYTLVDPAISQKTSADNTVVVTIAKEVDGPNIYRVREDAGHFTPEQTLQLIFAHQADYRSEVAIEVVQYQMALKYSVIEEQRKRQIYFTVHEIKSSTNKESRIRGLLPLYSAGVIHHRRGDVEYERELLAFPRGRRDDRIDAMSQWLLLDINTSSGTSKQYKPKWVGYGRKK